MIAIKNCSECLGIVKKREKGVDVQIAIDMVKGAYKNEFDYCILVSGDADFIPALELVKEIGKNPLSSFILSRSYAINLRRQFKSFFIKLENIEFDIIK